MFDQDVAVDISDKKTLVPTSRWFALSQVAASIRPWHRRAPGHWQCLCCHHRCRRYSFHSHHHGINNWLFLRCSICATTVPDAREYVYKRQVIDIGLGRSPGISNINFNTENIDRSIAILPSSILATIPPSNYKWQIWYEAFGDSIGGLEGGPTTSNWFFAQFPLNRIVVEYRWVLFSPLYCDWWKLKYFIQIFRETNYEANYEYFVECLENIAKANVQYWTSFPSIDSLISLQAPLYFFDDDADIW